MKRKEPTNSEDPIYETSSSSTPPHGGDYEGGTKRLKRNVYEVFLSFRGKDTRKGFTDYLYTNLVNAGIHVFRDDNELCVGEEIGPELLYSITQSTISIPIISENYTSSKWCLCELVQILKCKRNRGQIVLPIFYKVKPSQLRHPIGQWQDAINAHKENLNEMVVKEWEKVLEEVSSLKGWESDKVDNGHEGALVKIVVTKVMSELKRFFQLNVPEQLVGIDHPVEEIMSWINAKFNSTRIIGIHGMGGIGKTTLAKVLYNKLSSHFEYLSFVANIRETSQRNGIECLQKQLISDIIKSSWDVSNVDAGIGVLKSRFTGKKVLILLDDMDDHAHLKALVGDGSWFETGSIVIITTRNRSILDEAKAAHNYQLKELPSNQSLILFSRHAFRKDFPPSDYEDISRVVVSTTGGLPLALEVIGSFLCGKSKEAWTDTSKKLKKVPHKKVQETLRITYDTLNYEDQQMFLDIACFFIGSSKQYLTYMWESCGFFPGKGIEVLSLMSLIKIDKYGMLWMHDQLRDLGREIVRLENPKEPRKRSRLWNEEAVDVLDSNMGISKIEAIHLLKGGSYTAEQFKELTNLRFLKMTNVKFTRDFQIMLPQLRWLECHDCHLDLEVASFHTKKLVVLNMSCAQISENWRGWDPLKMATKLKVLNLSYCQSLRKTPDLSDFKSLEILILRRCDNLEEIHPSIGDIKTLVSLDVNECKKLKELSARVVRMEELRDLILNDTAIQDIPIPRDCLMKLENASFEDLAQPPESMGSLLPLTQLNQYGAKIKELPEFVDSLKELETVDAFNCRSLACNPSNIGSLVSLQHLLLGSCHSLKEIPDSIGKLASLTELVLSELGIEELPESIGSLRMLKTLYVSSCESLARIPSSIGSLMSLRCLSLEGCCSLREIPNSIGKLASLTELDLSETRIEELPESIGSLRMLETLDASFCESLARIPSSIGSLVSLRWLSLWGCPLLREIPDSIRKLTSLTELNLSKIGIKELPESISSLRMLQILNASSCKSLAHIPSSISSLVSLWCLSLQECCSLREIPDSIGNLVSLTELNLSGTRIKELPKSIDSLKMLETLDASSCESLARIPSSIGSLVSLRCLSLSKCFLLREIPDSIGKLLSLTELDLSETWIEELPESIGSLRMLETLYVSSCELLARIPSSIGSLVSLRCLSLKGCPSLREIPDSIGKLASLTKLDLSATGIKELPESIGSLSMLETLDASSCESLARIPSSIGSLVSLRCLSLPKCFLLREIPDSIGKLASFTELNLFEKRIEQLPESISSLRKLETLDASHCKSLARIPNSIDSLVSLRYLSLEGCCSLREIPDSIGKLLSLTELDLSKTWIEELPESIGSLRMLETLDASFCESLACIPNSIGSIVSLRCLSLEGCCSLWEIPDSIEKLGLLTELDLSETGIKELSESIGSLRMLETLDTSSCESLAHIPSSIGSLVSLRWLSLQGCPSLREIPDSIGKLASLTELNLSETGIEKLPESIGSLRMLKTFYVSSCESLAHIPSSIGSLVSLRCLSLEGCCSLREIPNSIGKLASLTELDLSETRIEELPESIGSLRMLETLDASFCESLARIPSSIGSLVSLQCLSLARCYSLREIPDSIGKLALLTKLDLSATGIKELPESIGSLKMLKILNISFCESLTCILNSIGSLVSLLWLSLAKCCSLREIPSSVKKLQYSGCRIFPHQIIL